MKKGLIGKKLGMSQVYTAEGVLIPVTVINCGPCTVISAKTVAKDGYSALQLGFGTRKVKNVSKAVLGNVKPAGLEANPPEFIKEIRLDADPSQKAGDVLDVDVFAKDEFVDVTGTTKGRGFSGVIKRWGCHRLRMTHGTGPVHRQPGSMGANSDPSRIMKNKKMAGQYGNEQVTILNLEVVKVDAERNLIAVKGAVPGSRGGIVFVRSTVK